MRRSRVIATLSETFWILLLAVLVLFAFFVALGAFKPAQVATLTIIMVALALLWVAHAMWDSRHRSGRDIATIRARERRGF